MPNPVKIVTDTAGDLPRHLVDQHNIAVVPLTIRFGEEQFVDQVELSTSDFWSRLDTSSELPTTSAPTALAFEEAFRKAHEEGYSGVVCITLSSKLSATYQAAVNAARVIGDEFEVRVIDSMLCTVAQASLCLEAARRAETGESVQEVADGVERAKEHTALVGTLDTLDNLRKGGRIGAAGAFFAALLSVKPVIQLRNGEVHPESRQRTRKKALAHLASLVIDRGPIGNVAIAHANAPDLDDFVEMLKPVVSPEDLWTTEIGPVIGTHGGRRLVAVSFTSQTIR